MNSFRDFVRRLGCSRGWIFAQFGVTLLLVLLIVAWTRLPERHVWQVALTLLIPLLLAICFLELEAGTMRALTDDDGKRVKFIWGAMTLLVWLAVFLALWAALDWCDDKIPEWAGYLNSRASAGSRATLFTYDHIQKWMTFAEWVLRWIAIPGKIVAYAMASAQWGWRLPVRRLIRLVLNWRWWLAVIAAALTGVALPGTFFNGYAHGTVSYQVWMVIFKLIAAYVLAVGSWILLLAWGAVLLDRTAPGAEDGGEYAQVPVPVLSGPLGEDPAKLPLS